METNKSLLKRSDITSLPGIKLFDNDEYLELYHYTHCSDNDNDFVKNCRGVIFTKSGDNVLQTFPYSNEYTVPYDDNNDIDMNDNNNTIPELNSIDLASYHIFDSYEGTIIRIFNYNNKWYVATHKKLDAFKSKWSSNDSFGMMFKKSLDTIYNFEDQNLKNFINNQSDDFNLYQTFLSKLDKSKTYLFLLRNNKDNRIVCDAPTSQLMFHVGTINDNILYFDENIGIPKPNELKFSTKKELFNYINDINYNEFQGVIVFPGKKF